jgi:lia operon protein LiaI
MMMKLGLLLVGGIATLILLTTIGPLLGLIIKLGLLYFIFKQFLKTEKTLAKIALGIIGFMILMSIVHHLPALISIIAAYVLYLVYKKWNEKKYTAVLKESDPFANFEKEWSKFEK